ncbi:serine/threonine protein kinase [Parafrankia colletiae]|uniref:non-specific serine/threonine protein kinase n=1 Tax=Parafrankia colletiae TaxID=573497 RepID=A0A1S1Q5Y4_9ACTN|nr:serine/threonine-protein kinase [Parafrankia colletiae]MCK9898978.1 serine/threonine protein kinase [Frankia sp. Cpl3]OHV29350.1 serine/threonine protein kinase [Parafrankia colletiae]
MSTSANSPSQPFAGAASPNTVLDNRYRLDGRIATGGMGEVWRGLDQTLGRPVAVKLLRPEYASDESFLVRFRGEARHAARLSHPGVASVYDYGEVSTADDYPTAYLVMELVEGEPLSAVLHREKRLTPDRMLDVLGQAADALQAAHALGVVHRDVKPGNLLLRHDGAVKVTDFGIARAVDAAPLTATGIMMGTAYYVSPEQASGRPVTPASDVYSLGVVAYECLAGRRPFDDRNPIVVVMAHQQDNPPPLPSDIPYQVRALVESAMAKDAGRRPGSAGAFARSAASIRRALWNAEAGRWNGADATTRHPAPSAPPNFGPGNSRAPSLPRTPSWNRPSGPSWQQPGGADPAAGGGAGQGMPATVLQPSPGAGPGPGPGPGRPGGQAGPSGPGRSGPGSGGPPGSRGGTGRLYSPGEFADYEANYQGNNDFGPRGQGGHGDPAGTLYQPSPPSWSDEPGDAAGGRSGRRRPVPASGGRRRLPLPVLIALLILTVLVVAVITRTFAERGGSENNSAAPASVLHLTPVEEKIVGAGGEATGTVVAGARQPTTGDNL